MTDKIFENACHSTAEQIQIPNEIKSHFENDVKEVNLNNGYINEQIISHLSPDHKAHRLGEELTLRKPMSGELSTSLVANMHDQTNKLNNHKNEVCKILIHLITSLNILFGN